ncbi:hypothetical protein AcW1_003939 [Taiwanofungus camphoratus]|nr:hypothetical protein AcV5_003888 [Antrodia cinnamomea]KAI0937904.1 hypothetical protein AcW1_003939 [Antrodia cinnamomea]
MRYLLLFITTSPLPLSPQSFAVCYRVPTVERLVIRNLLHALVVPIESWAVRLNLTRAAQDLGSHRGLLNGPSKSRRRRARLNVRIFASSPFPQEQVLQRRRQAQERTAPDRWKLWVAAPVIDESGGLHDIMTPLIGPLRLVPFLNMTTRPITQGGVLTV